MKAHFSKFLLEFHGCKKCFVGKSIKYVAKKEKWPAAQPNPLFCTLSLDGEQLLEKSKNELYDLTDLFVLHCKA